jgi:regulator of protease activity HflC (stomatin/prohibitin superfamily)
MLRRELDDVAENWGIDIASVAIEEIFLEDPGFQKQLDDRREVELYGEKRIEERKIEANQIAIRGRQKAERVALEAEAEREREINRVKQEIERAKVQFETKKIEVETFLQRKQYEAQKILIEAQGDVAELSAAKKVLTDNVIKMQLIQELPNLVEKMVSTLSQAILSPEQYVALITGMPIFQALKNLTEKSILSDKPG